MPDYIDYNCKDNDNKIRVYKVDNKVDEVHIQAEGETSWTVIGANDLTNALKL